MVELPYSLRVLLVEAINEYCERMDPGTDSDVTAEAVVEQLETVAEEISSVDAEDIIPSLEATMENGHSLVIALSDHLEATDQSELSGEELMLVENSAKSSGRMRTAKKKVLAFLAMKSTKTTKGFQPPPLQPKSFQWVNPAR